MGACAAEPTTYGQSLVDQVLARHRDLRSLSLQLQSPGRGDVVIDGGIAGRRPAASFRGSLEIDAPQVETAGSEVRIAVPLRNLDRRRIGTALFRFDAGKGRRTDELQANAVRIAEQLGRRAFDAEHLLEPYPYAAGLPSRTFAQHLVDRILERQDDVVALALHAPARAGGESLILGSSFGRIGKPDDEGDYVVIRTGELNMRVVPSGERFNLGLPMRDAAGRTVGLMTIAFAYRLGQDAGPLLRTAEKIRDELAKEIDRVERLGEPHADSSMK